HRLDRRRHGRDRRGVAMRKRRHLLAAIVLAAGATAAIVPVVSGDAPATPPVPQPVLGVADTGITLMGSSSPEAGSEAWAYRQLPRSAGEPSVGGNRLQLGPQTDPPTPQVAFLRYTAGSGWQYVDTPHDAN